MLTTTFILGFILIAALVVMMPLKFNTAYIPGPVDEATRLETAANKTASFNGTTFTFGTGYTPGGPGQQFGAVVNPTTLDRTTGDETYAFKVQESADGTTWTDASPSVSRTAVGAFSIPCFISQPNVRVNVTLAGTTPNVVYDAWLVPMQ